MKRMMGLVAVTAALVLLPVTQAGGAKPSSSCKKAIATYQQIDQKTGQAFGLISQGFKVAANYPEQYGPIANAIAKNDTAKVNSIAAKVKGWNKQLSTISNQLSPLERSVLSLKKKADRYANSCKAGH